MAIGYYKAGVPHMSGSTDIWAVDERGRVLHTEAICTVPHKWHQWFLDHLEGQEIPIRFADLLTHEQATS